MVLLWIELNNVILVRVHLLNMPIVTIDCDEYTALSNCFKETKNKSLRLHESCWMSLKHKRSLYRYKIISIIGIRLDPFGRASHNYSIHIHRWSRSYVTGNIYMTWHKFEGIWDRNSHQIPLSDTNISCVPVSRLICQSIHWRCKHIT